MSRKRYYLRAKLFLLWLLFSINDSVIACASVANPFYNDYTKYNLKIYQIYTKFVSITKTYILTLFFQCLFIVSRKCFTVTLCTAIMEMLQAQFLLSQFSSE